MIFAYFIGINSTKFSSVTGKLGFFVENSLFCQKNCKTTYLLFPLSRHQSRNETKWRGTHRKSFDLENIKHDHSNACLIFCHYLLVFFFLSEHCRKLSHTSICFKVRIDLSCEIRNTFKVHANS